MPNITGKLQVNRLMDGAYAYIEQGCLSVDKTTAHNGTLPAYEGGTTNYPMAIDASHSSSIYGSSDTVTPLSQKTNFIIKY